MAIRTGYINGAIVAGDSRGDMNTLLAVYQGAVAAGDVVQFGNIYQQYIPQYAILLTAIFYILDTGNAGALTGQVGYADIGGSTGTTSTTDAFGNTVNQLDTDPAYFISSATTVTPPLRVAKTNAKVPLILQKASLPTFTLQSGAITAAGQLMLQIEYQYKGSPYP